MFSTCLFYFYKMSSILSHTQLKEAAEKFGTPLYIYDAKRISEQYQKLTDAFLQSNVKIFYACKALTNISVLKHIQNLGCAVDCSSINEAKLCIHAGFSPSNILYTSNGIHFNEIEEAQSLGININIDSLSNLEKFGKKFGDTYPVGIRLRPNIMAGGNLKISTGHDKSKFGIDINQLNEIVEIVAENNMLITNLHIHTGSDIKDADVFVKGIEVLFDIIPHFPNLQSVDLGGGFKVAYKDGDAITDMKLLGQKVKEAFDVHPIAKNLQIWFEPGKFMVSECGYLVAEVNVIKESGATTFIGLNTGLNHLIRPMFYDAYHKIENLTNIQGQKKTYTITGNICETDTFATDRAIAETKEGDLLVFYNAGAYGYEMSSNFNSRFKPAEVLIAEDGTQKLFRKRYVFEDLLKGQLA